MKKLIIILFFVLPLPGESQMIETSASIETGYYNGVKVMQSSDRWLYIEYPKLSFYSDIEIGLHGFDRRVNFVVNSQTIFTDNTHFMNFTPLLVDYNTDLFYNPKQIPIKIGWKHRCVHTVKSRHFYYTTYNGSSNRIYVKLKIK